MKTVVITGASRGIGKAIAKEYAKNSYAVAILARDAKQIMNAGKDIKEHGHCMVFSCDVSDHLQVKKTFTAIQKATGSIDVLINNAGINARRTLNPNNWDNDFGVNLNGWRHELEINLTGSYICSYIAAGYMLKNRYGSIINISSIKGKEATSSPGYGASKAGVIKLTKDFAKALAPYGIRVNCIAPGFINTGMTAELSSEKQEAYKKQIPLGYFGTAAEVAQVAFFLSSPKASYIAGATLDVNGAYLM